MLSVNEVNHTVFEVKLGGEALGLFRIWDVALNLMLRDSILRQCTVFPPKHKNS